jgi:CRISPR-associated protein Cas2
MDYFISYDISDDRQRDKTARMLGEQGCKRVQKSVFLAPGFSAVEIRKLQQLLAGRIVPMLAGEDSILCIPVEKDWVDGLVWHGKNEGLARALESFPVKIL